MFTYISQAGNYIKNLVESLDDSVDPFEKGDLVEVKETHEYVEVKQTAKGSVTIKKPRTKAITSGKYGKNKGEKVPEWRMRIIPIYNEIKNVKYNANSKYYTSTMINAFIKEIEEIEKHKEIEAEKDKNIVNWIEKIETESINNHITKNPAKKSNVSKEWAKENKMDIYKNLESGKNPNHPKKYMSWLTKDEYDKLREIYRNREFENEKKSGYYKNDTEIWEIIGMQDSRDFEDLGCELVRYGIEEYFDDF